MDNYTKYGTVSQAIIYQRNERSTNNTCVREKQDTVKPVLCDFPREQ
jgi:hypothetical protein